MPRPVRPRSFRVALAYLAALALASFYTFPLGSCTAILLNAGLEADRRYPGPGIIPRESLVLLDPGAPVVLQLVDSTLVSGRYQGAGLGDPVGYRSAYEAWRSSRPDSASWPVAGAPVTAHGRSDPPWIRGGGAFVGFTARGVAVESRRRRGSLEELTFGETGAIGIGSRLLYAYDLHRALGDGVPVLTTIRVRTDAAGEARAVPWRDVEAVTLGKVGSRALKGALVGLALDAVVVVAVVNWLHDKPEPAGCDMGGNWSPLGGFASRAPGDYDTVTGRFVTRDEARALAADRAARAPAPALVPAAPLVAP